MKPIRLTAGIVHLWRVDLAFEAGHREELWALLDATERARAERMREGRLRRRYVAAHGRLRQILSAYLGCAGAGIRFSIEAGGKPRLGKDFFGFDLGFNLSHSGDLALVAVSREPWLGVDVEIRRDLHNLDAMVRKCFADSEIEEWRRAPESGRSKAFFDRWTQKESFVKACGKGIALGIRNCVISGADAPRLVAIPECCGDVREWTLFKLDPGLGASAAVCVRQSSCRFELFEFEAGALGAVAPVAG